jgi:transposase
MRYVPSNPIWKELEPRIAAAERSPARAPPELSDRLFLAAVLYPARTGTPRRDWPAAFRDWNAVCQRAKRCWVTGIWDRLLTGLPTDSAVQEATLLFVDWITVRAHPHVAGARKK